MRMTMPKCRRSRYHLTWTQRYVCASNYQSKGIGHMRTAAEGWSGREHAKQSKRASNRNRDSLQIVSIDLVFIWARIGRWETLLFEISDEARSCCVQMSNPRMRWSACYCVLVRVSVWVSACMCQYERVYVRHDACFNLNTFWLGGIHAVWESGDRIQFFSLFVCGNVLLKIALDGAC